MEGELQLTLKVYYDDADISARDISLNLIMDGKDTCSFTIKGVMRELYTTWRID